MLRIGCILTEAIEVSERDQRETEDLGTETPPIDHDSRLVTPRRGRVQKENDFSHDQCCLFFHLSIILRLLIPGVDGERPP